MQIILDDAIATGDAVLTLGMFDGVHLGHRVLIERGKALADRIGAPLIAGTFTTHPMALIAPERCPPMLTTLTQRARLMEKLGVDVLYAQAFTEQRMNTAPERFIADLCTRFHPSYIVAGFDYSFGAKGEGNAALLTALGEVFGYQASIVPRITYEGMEVSSTAIRAAIERGDMRHARLLLGRPYMREIVRTEDGEYSFVINGKMTPPKGVYRCLADTQERSVPVTTRVLLEGRVGLTPVCDDMKELQFIS